jgi:hypothetical protein
MGAPVTREVIFSMSRDNADCRSFDLLRDAYHLVCNQADIRGPIDCIVPHWMVGIVVEAIKFMTATVPICHTVPGREDVVRVTSIGYRAGPAGDH